MLFLVDAQLPPALTKLFTKASHEAIHVREAGLIYATDVEIATFAAREDMVIVTKDEDFMSLGNLSMTPHAPRVLWIRIGNTTNRALEARLHRLMPQILEALGAGEEVVEVR